mgnify:FL=1
MKKMYAYTSSFVQTLLTNPTRETIPELFDSTQVNESIAFGTAIDALIVGNMKGPTLLV